MAENGITIAELEILLNANSEQAEKVLDALQKKIDQFAESAKRAGKRFTITNDTPRGNSNTTANVDKARDAEKKITQIEENITAATTKIADNMSKMNDKVEQTFSGGASEKLDTYASMIANSIDNIVTQFNRAVNSSGTELWDKMFGNIHEDSPLMRDLTEDIQYMLGVLSKLQEEQSKVDEGSDAWNRLKDRITEVRGVLFDLDRVSRFASYNLRDESGVYINSANPLFGTNGTPQEEETESVAKLTAEEKKAAKETERRAKEAEKAAAAAREERKALVGAVFSKIGNTVSSLGRNVTRFFDQVKRIASRMLIRKAISAIAESINAGFSQLFSASARIAETMGKLKGAFLGVGASVASAFTPVIEAAYPALMKIAQAAVTAANAIGKFFATLFGTSYTVIELTWAVDELESSTSGAGKAAKGALADFDELNIIASKSGGGSGSGSGVSNGYTVTEGQGGVSRLAKLLNGGLFEEAGQHIASGINGWVEEINSNITVEKFKEIGNKVGRVLNGVFSDSSLFSNLGITFSNVVVGVISGVHESFTVTDFEEIGKAVVKFIEAIDYEKLFAETGGLVIKIAVATIKFSKALLQLDTVEIARQIGEGIREAFDDVTWDDIWEAVKFAADFGNLPRKIGLGTATGILAFLGIDDKVGEWEQELIDTAKGWLAAVGEFFKETLPNWCLLHIWKPIRDVLGDNLFDKLFPKISNSIDIAINAEVNGKKDVEELSDTVDGLPKSKTVSIKATKTGSTNTVLTNAANALSKMNSAISSDKWKVVGDTVSAVVSVQASIQSNLVNDIKAATTVISSLPKSKTSTIKISKGSGSLTADTVKKYGDSVEKIESKVATISVSLDNQTTKESLDAAQKTVADMQKMKGSWTSKLTITNSLTDEVKNRITTIGKMIGGFDCTVKFKQTGAQTVIDKIKEVVEYAARYQGSQNPPGTGPMSVGSVGKLANNSLTSYNSETVSLLSELVSIGRQLLNKELVISPSEQLGQVVSRSVELYGRV